MILPLLLVTQDLSQEMNDVGVVERNDVEAENPDPLSDAGD